MRLGSLVLACIVVTGCSSQMRPTVLPGTSRALDDVSTDAAFDAAVRAVQLRYGLGKVNRDNYIVRGAPEYFTAKDDQGTLASQLTPSKRNFRKIPTVYVLQSPGGKARVSVRVEVQRQDTAVRQAFAYQREMDDSPASTPIEHRSPQGPEKNEVWTMVRRDLLEEQNILKVITSQLQDVND